MIRINLIRGKRKKRKELNLEFLFFVIPLVVVAGLFFYHRTVTGRIEKLKVDIAKANAEIARLKNEIGEVEKFKARKAELQKKVDIIANLQKGRKASVAVFSAVAAALPEKCWIDSMSFKDDRIELRGIAQNNNTIAGFMTNLGQSGRFRDVVLGTAEQAPLMGQKLVRFNLTFQVVN